MMKKFIFPILSLGLLSLSSVSVLADEVNLQDSNVIVTQDGEDNKAGVSVRQSIRSGYGEEEITNPTSAGSVQNHNVDILQQGRGNETRVRGRQSIERNYPRSRHK